MEEEKILKIFFSSFLRVTISLFGAYLYLLGMYFYMNCWKKDYWDELFEKSSFYLPRNLLFLESETLKPKPFYSPNSEKYFSKEIQKIRKTEALYYFGVKTIKLLNPRENGLYFLSVLLLIGTFVRTVLVYSGIIINDIITIEVILFSVPAIITAIQSSIYFLFSDEKPLTSEPKKEISLWELHFSHKARFVRPKNTYLFNSSDNFVTYIETNEAFFKHNTTNKFPLYLFISIKSRNFNNEFFKYVFNKISPLFYSLTVVLVDRPYEENLRADFKGRKLTEELEKLQKIKTERHQTITSIQYINEKQILNWDDISINVDPRIRQEVENILNKEDSLLYNDVLSEILRVIGGSPYKAPKYIGFIKKELPVLIHTYYYEHDISVADIYPGKNSPIIWFLEEGRYHYELPFSSKLSKERPLVYLGVKNKLT